MLKQISNNVVCGIYKIESPIGKVYIGQSINIYKRIANYRCGHCKNQIYLHRSIKKYGWEQHYFEIIHICLPEELNVLEKYYVDLFQSFSSKNGLNVKDGGGKTGSHSEETKIKIGLGNKGKIVSKETREKIGYLSSQKKLSESHKKAFTFSGRKHTEEYKQKAAIRNSGTNSYFYGKRKFGADHHMYGTKRKEESLNLYRKIILNTETGIFYMGAKSAAESMNLHWPTLKNRLNGNIKNNTSFKYV